MERPLIICHMVTSIDGKVTGEFLDHPNSWKAADVYYQIHRDYQADAFACGRITMEGSFTGGFQPDLTPYRAKKVPPGDYVADSGAAFYAVAFDRHGRLGWTSSHISDEDPGYDKAHIIEVLCEDAPEAYRAYLREIGVSYILAGTDELDLPLALEKLKRLFHMQTLLLEGGSILNGAFQRADMIDAFSLVVSPVMADKKDRPLCEGSLLQAYRLQQAAVMEDSILWLRYSRNN